MNGNLITLPGKRLGAAASYIRRGAYLADIGTDHAFLPIYAVERKLARRAVASDVNEAPLKNAIANIAAHGLTDSISCMLTSGFDGMESIPITDAAICGMGGELISEIIRSAPFIKRKDMRLILQPMTMPEKVRFTLGAEGFTVEGETVVFEDRKYYTVINADYTGEITAPDEFASLFGDPEKVRYESEDCRREFLEHKILKYTRIIEGKSLAGLDTSSEKLIRSRLEALLQEGAPSRK